MNGQLGDQWWRSPTIHAMNAWRYHLWTKPWSRLRPIGKGFDERMIACGRQAGLPIHLARGWLDGWLVRKIEGGPALKMVMVADG